MKKLFQLSLFLIPIFLFAQEVDQAYLDSLPEGVRSDVKSKIASKKELEKPIYRSASSRLDKTPKTKQELEYDKSFFTETPVFGENFFDTYQSSFMPTNEPNLDDSYILDSGDVLEIQLVGQKNSIVSHSINRDGSINISGIGRLNLSGLSLESANSFIKSKVSNTFIATDAFVSLVNVRDIGILIAGNAFNPGIYTLNGNSNMLHAIAMAGGIDSIGSYRNIKLIRDNEVIDNIDLYDVLIKGKSNFYTSLRTGDSIVISPVGKIVSIESGVLRPGRYELKDGESFTDLINYANGKSLLADVKNIILHRFTDGQFETINTSIDNIGTISPKKGDTLFVTEYKVSTVNIKGAVINPGTYKLPLGSTLSELIKLAGGYEDTAYPFGSVLINKKALEINRNSKNILYEKFLDNIVNNSGVFSSSDSGNNRSGLILEQLRDAPVTGRVIAEFNLDVIANQPNLDTALEDGDSILIPNTTQQVYVQGEVSNPGAVRYSSGKGLDYYINSAGSTLESADRDTVFIVHPNGETFNFASNSRLSFIKANNKPNLIYPGSIIFIPKTTNMTNSLQIASVWAPILSSLALSITSLSIISD